MSNFPELLIAGAAKSGTTSLYDALCTNKRIFSSNIKEPNFHYFNKITGNIYNLQKNEKHKVIPPEYSIDKDNYKQLYSKKGDKIAIDASPVYLFKHDICIGSIKNLYGPEHLPKILIILRNPVDRAWSHYLHHVRTGAEIRKFDDIIKEFKLNLFDLDLWPGWDYIGQGFYFESLKKYKESFENVQVIFFDDFIQNYEKTMSEINGFIGIEKYTYKVVKSNVSGLPKQGVLGYIWENAIYSNLSKNIYNSRFFPVRKRFIKRVRDSFANVALEKKNIPEQYKKELQKIYAPEIHKLEKEENRELGHWLKR